jgi:hypothetical protein
MISSLAGRLVIGAKVSPEEAPSFIFDQLIFVLQDSTGHYLFKLTYLLARRRAVRL